MFDSAICGVATFKPLSAAVQGSSGAEEGWIGAGRVKAAAETSMTAAEIARTAEEIPSTAAEMPRAAEDMPRLAEEIARIAAKQATTAAHLAWDRVAWGLIATGPDRHRRWQGAEGHGSHRAPRYMTTMQPPFFVVHPATVKGCHPQRGA